MPMMMVTIVKVRLWRRVREPGMSSYSLRTLTNYDDKTTGGTTIKRFCETSEGPLRLLQWAHEIAIRGDTELSDACLSHICVSVCSLVFSQAPRPQCATFETLMSSGEKGGDLLNCHDEHGWFVIIHVDTFNLMWLRNQEAVTHQRKLLFIQAGCLIVLQL